MRSFNQVVAERIVEHTVLHWDEIPDRENTIEQALLRMSNNGVVLWPLLSNALRARKDISREIFELLNRIVDRLHAGEIKLGECTEAISEYADACVNPESVCVLSKKIRQDVVLPVEESEEN